MHFALRIVVLLAAAAFLAFCGSVMQRHRKKATAAQPIPGKVIPFEHGRVAGRRDGTGNL